MMIPHLSLSKEVNHQDKHLSKKSACMEFKRTFKRMLDAFLPS